MATVTDAIVDLIQQKEKVANAQKWRKRQEQEKLEKMEQQRKEEIALTMQHGMEGR